MTSDPTNSDDPRWDDVVELTEAAIDLRQQMALQLSQIIIRTKAVWLDPEILIGAILEAVDEANPSNSARWKWRGATYLSNISRLGEGDTQLTEPDGT